MDGDLRLIPPACLKCTRRQSTGHSTSPSPSSFSRNSLPPCSLFIRLLLCFIALLHRTSARRLPNIYWNSSNPIFHIDNTDHVIPVRILDRINIVCPFHSPDSLFDPAEVEFSSIYSVSRWSYDNCQLTADSERVGFCTQSMTRRSIITLVFREFSPLHPGVLEFKPGHSYYFISTSNGTKTGVESRYGGLCNTRNMKLKFEVQIPPRRNDEDEWTKSKMLVKDVRDANNNPVQHVRPETTPVMYVIHDRYPEDVHPQGSAWNENGEDIEVEEEEDGGADSVKMSMLSMLVIVLLTLRWNWG